MELPENYKNREQAFIKHCLLKQYLERLFMIIGQHHKEICYVDCFAGPWQEESPDLDDTSIAISLSIIGNCRSSLAEMGRSVKFRALFIEKNPSSYERLERFISSGKWSDIETKAMCGEFYELRSHICKWCNDQSFAFFFVDPTGWKNVIEIETLRPLLQRNQSEFLITFMFDFILRTHGQPPFEEDMKAIFGETPHTEGMTSKERENHLTGLYKSNLKSVMAETHGRPRSAHVKVLYPTKDRTLYDLVYLTRHPLGIQIFMQESEKLDLIQKRIRAQAKQDHRINKSRQTELFYAAEFDTSEMEDEISLFDVKKYWINKLSHDSKRFGLVELADMLEDTGWFESNFQNAFKELEKEGKVRNCDKKRNRPTNVVNFQANNNSGECLVKV